MEASGMNSLVMILSKQTEEIKLWTKEADIKPKKRAFEIQGE